MHVCHAYMHPQALPPPLYSLHCCQCMGFLSFFYDVKSSLFFQFRGPWVSCVLFFFFFLESQCNISCSSISLHNFSFTALLVRAKIKPTSLFVDEFFHALFSHLYGIFWENHHFTSTKTWILITQSKLQWKNHPIKRYRKFSQWENG